MTKYKSKTFPKFKMHSISNMYCFERPKCDSLIMQTKKQDETKRGDMNVYKNNHIKPPKIFSQND